MPNVMTRADSLRQYLTGAGSDGGAQANPNLALGNFRSSSEWGGMAISYINSPLPFITVDYASGKNAVGKGILVAASANTLTWHDLDNADGDPVTIANGEQKVIESADPGAFIRVTRTSATALSGESQINIARAVNNIFGMTNISAADAAAGIIQYRGIIMKNVSVVQVQNLKRWIAELATVQVSNGGQLGAAGAGTIVTTGTFADWPVSGYAHIFQSGGTSREIVYYTSRTNTVLTVPAAGRGLLGSAAGAGAGTDLVRCVPGIAIAIDTAGVTAPGAIQTIANETTSPAAVSFNTGVFASTGLNIGNMDPGQQVGIWIKRQIPAGAAAIALATDKSDFSFDAV